MKRAERQPEMTDLTLYAGIFCKRWTVPDRGTLLPQHSHEHPHISYIVSGAVRVWCGEQELGDYAAPAAIKIEARELHQFLTLTDDVTILCIHNADHIEGDEPAVAAEHQFDLED
jgi:quercetin dioxygenase-like cupin family protein